MTPKSRRPPLPVISHVTCLGRVYRVRETQWRFRDRNGDKLPEPQPRRLLVEEGDGTVFVLGGQRLSQGAWQVYQPVSRSGGQVTDRALAELSREAERGYDLSKGKQIKRGELAA